MQLTNFQTLLLLLQMAVCEAIDPAALPFATVTAPAQTAMGFVKRHLSDIVIGSTSVSAYATPTTWSCPPGSTWTSVIPYAGCQTVAAQEQPMYTGCANTSLLLGPFDVDTCTGTGFQTFCVTGYIYYDHDVTLSNYDCWPTWTDGNWKAWRLEPEGTPLSTVIAIAVVVPLVVIGTIVVLLWWWRKRRRDRKQKEVMHGVEHSPMSSPKMRPKSFIVATDVEMPGRRKSYELDGRRRESELSGSMDTGDIGVHRMPSFEEERDDAQSWHSAASQHARHELQGFEPSNQTPNGPSPAPTERNALQSLLQRFRM